MKNKTNKNKSSSKKVNNFEENKDNKDSNAQQQGNLIISFSKMV